jgi:hypothetical protein
MAALRAVRFEFVLALSTLGVSFFWLALFYWTGDRRDAWFGAGLRGAFALTEVTASGGAFTSSAGPLGASARALAGCPAHGSRRLVQSSAGPNRPGK